jgi:transposase
MIGQDKRTAALAMHREGMPKRKIAANLKINVKTVRSIIAGKGHEPGSGRRRQAVDAGLLSELYARCDGYVQRMHEILALEHGIAIAYSTLTRIVRRQGLGAQETQRAIHVPDEPGLEMQHDTSVYKIRIGGVVQKIIASSVYLRYSKMRYIKFYRLFNRFQMKCFFHEALLVWDCSARRCVVDNTSLVVVAGSGPDALFAPEMVAFANDYGFHWMAHAIGHANRKAGCERSFWTLETNFFPGRTFSSLEDLNEQVVAWATDYYANRPQSHTGLVPAKLFEHEKPHLLPLSEFIAPPMLPHKRLIDKYGYINFDGNFYWVPPVKGREVSVIQYATQIVIFQTPAQELQRYDLPPEGIKGKPFAPPSGPHRQPSNLKKGSSSEEANLRAIDAAAGEYLDFIRSPECTVTQKGLLIRTLYQWSLSLNRQRFLELVRCCLKWHVGSPAILNDVAWSLQQADPSRLITADPCDDLRQRPSYQQGKIVIENPIDPDASESAEE